MNNNKIIERIAEIEKEISALPSGSVTKKKIKEHNFGKINGKYVIYRGESFTKDEIKYLNVEEYLKSL